MLELDRQLLLWFNGSDSLFIDGLALAMTSAYTWIPLYLALLYVVIKNNDEMKDVLFIIGGVALCLLLTGTLCDTYVKPTVARFRPTHDPVIGLLVDTVDGYRGGDYGFFSSHAANTMSVAVFFSWLFRNRIVTFTLVAYSLLNCWTRLYLGVHFPGDVLVGAAWGATVASIIYFGISRLQRAMQSRSRFISDQYTATGYVRDDMNAVVGVFLLTLLYCIIRAVIYGI